MAREKMRRSFLPEMLAHWLVWQRELNTTGFLLDSLNWVVVLGNEAWEKWWGGFLRDAVRAVILLPDQETIGSLSGAKGHVFICTWNMTLPDVPKGNLWETLLGGLIYFVTLGTISGNYEAPKGGIVGRPCTY